jgi:hypothetical protein
MLLAKSWTDFGKKWADIVEVCSHHTKYSYRHLQLFHFIHVGPMSGVALSSLLVVADLGHDLSFQRCCLQKVWQIWARNELTLRLFAHSFNPLRVAFLTAILDWNMAKICISTSLMALRLFSSCGDAINHFSLPHTQLDEIKVRWCGFVSETAWKYENIMNSPSHCSSMSTPNQSHQTPPSS